MSDQFVFYDLEKDVVSTKKYIINIDTLLKDIKFGNKKNDALFSPNEVAGSIIKELQKLEEKTKDFGEKYTIHDVYTIEVKNISQKKPNYVLHLKMDVDYYPMVTPNIKIIPPLDPIYTFQMISHPDLDTRNTDKIRNIEYIVERVKTFIDECNINSKLNDIIANNMIDLLKNNNFRIKTAEVNTNINKSVNNKSGIGYGCATKWDVNAYLNNIVRIKTENIQILNNIYTYVKENKENNDIQYIHDQFGLRTFWIDLIEKYELTDEAYFTSIYNILYILEHLKIKINIPFLNDFVKLYNNNDKYKHIIQAINNIKLIEEKVINSNEQYITALKDMQSDIYPYQANKKHYFLKELKDSKGFNTPNVTKLVMKQYGIISSSLPLSKESAIFFRYDPDNISLFKFLIIPNQDTPYKFGCFVFEAYIPNDFPNSPPLINHSTSRINKFRFNPNLYDCGKVCLSLLGTWSGSESEKWIPPKADGTGSTLFQVVMSIYSMVFSEDPWFNEPGRERGLGDASNNKTAIEYNQNIRNGTIKYAIINQLKYPENGFEDVIKTHFKLRKDEVSEYLKEQNADVKQFESLLT